MWHEVMAQVLNSTTDATLIAVDLPGLGGSQGLPDYSAQTVLDCLCEFVCTMREQYFESSGQGKVLIVAHDWGAALGFKLAVAAPQLADRFILANGPFVSLLGRVPDHASC